MKNLDLVIIGSGPGGYVAAIRASQLGRKVTIIEKKDIGGTCLNVGCVPSKALLHAGHQFTTSHHASEIGVEIQKVSLSFEKMMKWKDIRVVKKLRLGVTQLLKKNNVDIIVGEATFVDKRILSITTSNGIEKVQFNDCVIATGSKPIELKVAPIGKYIVDSTGALNFNSLPKSMVVIGAGYIGSELAQAYAMLGSDITIIEASSTILPGFEKKLSNEVLKGFDELNIKVYCDSTVINTIEKDDGVTVEVKDKDKIFTIETDVVLVSVGRYANTKTLNLDKIGVKTDQKGLIDVNKQCATSLKNIYAIGDVVAGLQLAHKASYEAKIVAEVLVGKKVEVDYKAIPAVCYTTPEVATTGLTLAEAKEKGYEAVESEFPLMANSRSIATNLTQGFVKLVTDEKSKLILGAQIVGQQASEIITNVTLAIESGFTAEDLSLTIFPHPSVSEAIMDNAELAMGFPIHI